MVDVGYARRDGGGSDGKMDLCALTLRLATPDAAAALVAALDAARSRLLRLAGATDVDACGVAAFRSYQHEVYARYAACAATVSAAAAAVDVDDGGGVGDGYVDGDALAASSDVERDCRVTCLAALPSPLLTVGQAIDVVRAWPWAAACALALGDDDDDGGGGGGGDCGGGHGSSEADVAKCHNCRRRRWLLDARLELTAAVCARLHYPRRGIARAICQALINDGIFSMN